VPLCPGNTLVKSLAKSSWLVSVLAMFARRGLIAAVVFSTLVLVFLAATNSSAVSQFSIPPRLAQPWEQLKEKVWRPAAAHIVDDVIAPAVAIIADDTNTLPDTDSSVVLVDDPPQQIACPDPLAPEPLPASLSDEQEICKPMPARESDPFTITLCRKPSACNTGSVLIERRDSENCANLEAHSWPSRDHVEAAEIKRQWGPDAFEIQFDGPERLVLARPEYEGSCSYRYPFRLRNSGPFSVQVYWMYTVRLFFLHFM
jgi:hypothetical protein